MKIFFKSIGLIKVQDKKKILMSLRKSILIQKKKYFGTDIKAYLNQDNFRLKKKISLEYFLILFS